MRSETNDRRLIDKVAFIGFLVLVASLSVQKPALFTIAGKDLAATDILFPVSALLTLIATFLGSTRSKWHPIFLFFFLYLAAFVVGSAFAPDVGSASIKSLATAYLVGIAVVTIVVVDDGRRMRIAIVTFVAASLIPVTIGILTIVMFYVWPDSSLLPKLTYHYGAVPVGNYPRLSSTFVSASMFCNFLNIVLMFLLIAFGRAWIDRTIFRIGIAGAAVCSAFTISGGIGAVALAVGIFIWFKCHEAKLGRIALGSGTAICLLSLLASLFALQPHATAPYTFRMPLLGIELYPSSRLMVWSQAWETFTTHFLVGNGPGSASAAVVFQNTEGTYSLLTDAHNSFLSVATQTGILGLTAFSALVIYLLKIGFSESRNRPVQFGLAVAFLSAFVIQGLTGSFEDARHLWFLIGTLAAASTIDEKRLSPAEIGGSA